MPTGHLKIRFVLDILVRVIVVHLAVGLIIRVDTDAMGNNNNTSWENTYNGNGIQDVFAYSDSSAEQVKTWLAGAAAPSGSDLPDANDSWPQHIYDFDVDANGSSVTATMTISVSTYGQRTDSDSSPVRGWIEAMLTPPDSNYSNFQVIHITDFEVQLTRDLYLSFSFFEPFGTGTVIGKNLTIRMCDLPPPYCEPAPPAMVSEDGSFHANAYMLVEGTLEYHFPFANEQIDIYGFSEMYLLGTVQQYGRTIQLNLDIAGEIAAPPGQLPPLVTSVSTTYLGNILGEATSVFWNRADLNCDGIINFADFVHLANDWLRYGQPLLADITDDQYVTMPDVATLVASWLGTAIWFGQ